MPHSLDSLADVAPALLWTALPAELVLHGLIPEATTPVEIHLGSRVLQVDSRGDGTGTLRRLISSDPSDYLDPRWQPGAIIPVPTS